MRVWPRDLDVLNHLNNGVYLTMMDLGRMDLMLRSGVWARITANGLFPVVSAQTISYRKSLAPWQSFELQTRIAGYDERSVYIEQRFVARGEIYARAIMSSRFLRRAGGTVGVAELLEKVGGGVEPFAPEEWVRRWASDVSLPSTRSEAPSTW